MSDKDTELLSEAYDDMYEDEMHPSDNEMEERKEQKLDKLDNNDPLVFAKSLYGDNAAFVNTIINKILNGEYGKIRSPEEVYKVIVDMGYILDKKSGR